jgi:hypothetical protein
MATLSLFITLSTAIFVVQQYKHNALLFPCQQWLSNRGTVLSYNKVKFSLEQAMKARFSAAVQTGPGAHPASYTMGTGSLSRG